ncbi:MAG: hypothetical protein M1840_003034 [Geoglossum simile]|nr:MAG: hypothetical protein M1840_003034 [Geoglossum simile]
MQTGHVRPELRTPDNVETHPPLPSKHYSTPWRLLFHSIFHLRTLRTRIRRTGLIVELAHEQFPDLSSLLDPKSHPERPARLPYETAASLIADIADGIQILHDHDLVHADLKPRNILLFPNSASRCGLTAKIDDFGFAGMTTYTYDGRRAPLADGRPRGGTPEWNAPECLKNSDPHTSYSLDHPQYKPSRDVYSFGLLTAYIALDGQSPNQYVDNLADVKLKGKMQDAAVARIEQYYKGDEAAQERSLQSAAVAITRSTLLLDPQTRAESLRALKIRNLLFNDLLVSPPSEKKERKKSFKSTKQNIYIYS